MLCRLQVFIVHLGSALCGSPTHQGDELVLQLVVQTGDHHLHCVSDLSDPLVLRSPHSLDVSLLTEQPQRQTQISLCHLEDARHKKTNTAELQKHL